MANLLKEVLEMDAAMKARNAPTQGTQTIVNADGTTTQIPYTEDRFGRRTVMTSTGPKVLRGHEGKRRSQAGTGLGNLLGGILTLGRTPPYVAAKEEIDYFDMGSLGPKATTSVKPYQTATGETVFEETTTDPAGNVTTRFLNLDGSVIADPRDAQQAGIAEDSVTQQARAKPDFVGPPRPENLDELRAAEEREARQQDLFGATPDTFASKTIEYNDGSFQAIDKNGKITLITKNGRRLTPSDPGYKTALAISVASGSGTSSPPSFFKPEFYENGSYVSSNNAGEVTITTEQGITYSPSDPKYADAMREAVASGVLRASEMAFAKGMTETQVAESATLTNSIEAAQNKLGIYGEMLDAIDAGADTGFIASKVPSLTEASILLNNMQSQLGLDLIQNTTFGALSESELKFALDTAAPTDLQPEALRRWVVRKQAAQEKLINYLYEINAYLLAEPGNTKAKYLRDKRARRSASPQRNSGESDVPKFEENTQEGSSSAKKSFLEAAAAGGS